MIPWGDWLLTPARAAIHRGDAAAAREQVIRAARLRPLLTHALPVVSVQALLELARAYLALTGITLDVPTARAWGLVDDVQRR